LTQHENKEYIMSLLQAGAVGYISKRARANELLEAIRTVHTTGAYLPPDIASRVVRAIAESAETETSASVLLTEREVEIVRLIAE
jgi:two-component system NarL family response regulator